MFSYKAKIEYKFNNDLNKVIRKNALNSVKMRMTFIFDITSLLQFNFKK